MHRFSLILTLTVVFGSGCTCLPFPQGLVHPAYRHHNHKQARHHKHNKHHVPGYGVPLYPGDSGCGCGCDPCGQVVSYCDSCGDVGCGETLVPWQGYPSYEPTCGCAQPYVDSCACSAPVMTSQLPCPTCGGTTPHMVPYQNVPAETYESPAESVAPGEREFQSQPAPLPPGYESAGAIQQTSLAIPSNEDLPYLPMQFPAHAMRRQ